MWLLDREPAHSYVTETEATQTPREVKSVADCR